MFKRLWEILMSYLALYDEEDYKPEEDIPYVYELGDVTIKYEVGAPEPGIIVNNPGDPGGKSYGVFQMSLAKKTLHDYVKKSAFSDRFQDVTVGSDAFDKIWLDISSTHKTAFIADQRDYITVKFYKAVERYAHQQGFSTDLRSIQEALFSISVQHAGFKKIIKGAKGYRAGDMSPVNQIHALYSSRAKYVESLQSLPDSIKSAIYSRYEKEKWDVLSVYEHYDV